MARGDKARLIPRVLGRRVVPRLTWVDVLARTLAVPDSTVVNITDYTAKPMPSRCPDLVDLVRVSFVAS
jgi:hypothetical protein